MRPVLVVSFAVTTLLLSLLVLAQQTLTSTNSEKQSNVNIKGANSTDHDSIASWFPFNSLMRPIRNLLNFEVQNGLNNERFQRVSPGYLNYKHNQEQLDSLLEFGVEFAPPSDKYQPISAYRSEQESLQFSSASPRSQKIDQTLSTSDHKDFYHQLSVSNDVTDNQYILPSSLTLSPLNMTKNTSLASMAPMQQELNKCHTNKFDKMIAQKISSNDISRPIIRSDGRFDNPFPKTWKQPSMLDVAKFLVLEPDESSVPKSEAELEKELPLLKPNFLMKPQEDTFRVTWIGHSTLLIQIDGLNILTDPIFSDRASFTQFFGPKRIRRPACDIGSLPRIDIVLISHNHYDHLDTNSVRQLNDRFGGACRWIVPLGLGEYFQTMSVENYVELDWWQKDCYHIGAKKDSQLNRLSSLNINDPFNKNMSIERLQENSNQGTRPRQRSELDVYLTPTQHWTRRGVADINKTLWGSYVIVSRDGSSFFFGGDTAYCTAFEEIGKIFGPFVGAAIPIGAYRPRWFLKYSHVDPDEAVKIHRELRSMKSIAIHHSTFILSNEHYKEPAKLLNEVMSDLKVKGLVKEPFTAIRHGESVNFSKML